jgi:hypothetical protein
LGGVYVDAGVVKSYQNFEHGVFVGDVEATLVFLKTVNHVGNGVRQPFFVGLEEESNVVS